MKDISIYFNPLILDESIYNADQLGSKIIRNQDSFPEIKKNSIVLISVPEYRGETDYESKKENKTEFRKFLYHYYFGGSWTFDIVDLGGILPGKSINDTYFALSNVVAELVKINAIPVVIGGSQDLIFSVYKGYEKLEQMVNICSIDYALDLGEPTEQITSNGYLSQILLNRPCYLFNHANIGLQIPFINPKQLELFDKLYFDICRLGEFNSNFKKAEPHLRNADIINIDFNSIKSSEIYNIKANPNGFYAEQICQISKYAGISDKVTTFGIFNYNYFNQTSDKLLAEIIWYFIDGVSNRKGDFPIGSKKDYIRFTVNLDDFKDEIFVSNNTFNSNMRRKRTFNYFSMI
jgi:hypothetical protein